MTSTCSKIFDWENRVSMDNCALVSKKISNDSIQQYNLYNFYGDCEYDTVQKTALCHPNLHFRNGYGFTSACTVDTDSAIRLPNTTHGPEKKQLHMRNFHSVPNMGRGTLVPDTESFLKNGMDTNIQSCIEKETDYAFIPLIDCVQNYITGYAKQDFFHEGINSREETRRQMRKCATKKQQE
jgi:hypothetical protein